ncbi:glycosyltransferase WbuB [Bradyrhizobium sp. MOS001]|uniref:glycosyltransferase family 4 protein n=1 Tax=Bradyrhizobium sp. MOS001 TaxID=2133948 RepID=UPI0010757133|nr:glycosyltransferase family 4 protein [Bradyrhizobium sp. MOS001]TFW61138.1 glycosyltransferase WbuB [Bradyrhizobium sp. MOS001]
MDTPAKLIIAAQFYPPDTTTTAVYVSKIADSLAQDRQVVVISATLGSGAAGQPGKPEVVELKSWNPRKSAIIQRAAAICLLAARMFLSVLRRARPDDIVFCVTTPFTLPYTVLLAARLRGAKTMLLIYDLYPEALEAAGIARSNSLAVHLIRFANALLFRRLDAIIVIGRDVAPLVEKYPGVAPEKLHFIPNWALIPIGYRRTNTRFRAPESLQFIVGLSGNLGFTHDPVTVFEAARLLRDETSIHFVLSGWGVGWNQLVELQRSEGLANVRLIEPVPQSELVDFLEAADLWIIPYRRNTTGVSVPSRFYNLLAVGRPAIVAAEPDSEAALLAQEEDVGWVVPPEAPAQLAETILRAARDRGETLQKGHRAASLAEKYGEEGALTRYREVVHNVLGRPRG